MADIIEIDAITGERIERSFTPEEIAQRELDIAEYNAAQLAREQEEANKLAAKQSALAKLTALGLTEEEVLALLGNAGV
jgi:hypothetical protein